MVVDTSWVMLVAAFFFFLSGCVVVANLSETGGFKGNGDHPHSRKVYLQVVLTAIYS